ncbi:unnamed protein product [Agarophyton chilense]
MEDLVRGMSFIWEEDQKNSFSSLDTALTSAPVLVNARANEEFVMSTDAPKYAVESTLEQDGHLVAYLSHRLSNPEKNWDTVEQDLLTFMIALEDWSLYLRSRRFVLYIYYEPLRYLRSNARLSRRQARWVDVIQEYKFEIRHVLEALNVVPDALSRCADHLPALRMMNLASQDMAKRVQEGCAEDDWM